MADNTPNSPQQTPDQYVDVLRAGLNPRADYGGHEAQQAAGEAIRAIMAETQAAEEAAQTAAGETGQMSFFGAGGKVRAELQEEPKQMRAVLGSAALSEVQRQATPPAQPKVERLGYNDSRYSPGANIAARRADAAWLNSRNNGRNRRTRR